MLWGISEIQLCYYLFNMYIVENEEFHLIQRRRLTNILAKRQKYIIQNRNLLTCMALIGVII